MECKICNKCQENLELTKFRQCKYANGNLYLKSLGEYNFKKCWDLNNLRPLEAKVNMHDGSTRIRHKMYLKELSDE